MAEQLLEQDPTLQVSRFFKRMMGVSDPVCYDDNGAAWYAEGVSALLLKKLAFDVETMAHQPVDEVVITVPAHFNDPQRKSVLAAATLADIEVMGLVEEPVAAALHYGVVGGVHDQVLLVYDFGGGTFDATAMSMDARGVYVLAKTGITELGGKEIDEKVGAMILAQFERALGQQLAMGARTLLELRRISEEIKIELCLPGKSRVRRMAMLGGQAVEIEIARSEFDAAIAEFLDRTDAEMMACLREAGLRSEDVGSLLLVGGSSLVPLVEDRLRAIFHRPASRCCTTSRARRSRSAPPSTRASWRATPSSTTSRPSCAACPATASASAPSTRRPATSASTPSSRRTCPCPRASARRTTRPARTRSGWCSTSCSSATCARRPSPWASW
jgi:molecular chaperone DnaK (HSP70)